LRIVVSFFDSGAATSPRLRFRRRYESAMKGFALRRRRFSLGQNEALLEIGGNPLAKLPLVNFGKRTSRNLP
jgi:hypothetical protein